MQNLKIFATKTKQYFRTEKYSQIAISFNKVITNSCEIIPVKDMQQLAQYSYQIENFEEICQLILKNISSFEYNNQSSQRILNLLNLLGYLLKNGASAFIDEFRQLSTIFQGYSHLNQNNQEINHIILPIKARAVYLFEILADSNKLQREKQLSQLIRSKFYIQHPQKNIQQSFGNHQQHESIIQHYLWKNILMIDKKFDQISDKILLQIDQFIFGQIPESFDIDEIEIQNDKKQKIVKSTEKIQFQLQAQHQYYKQKNKNNSKQIQYTELI